MALGINVSGGSGAGCRRPMKEPRTSPWVCKNGHENKASHTRCFTLGCNTREEQK